MSERIIHQGDFCEEEIQKIVTLFARTTILGVDESEPNQVLLEFKKKTSGWILLRIIWEEDQKAVGVIIGPKDAENEIESARGSHSIYFDNCVQIYHLLDGRKRIPDIAFEDESGKHLVITRDGLVYVGTVLAVTKAKESEGDYVS